MKFEKKMNRTSKVIFYLMLVAIFLLGGMKVGAITSNEVTYENEGISETLTNTIDNIYRELKEY